jgi:hypothetical protein
MLLIYDLGGVFKSLVQGDVPLYDTVNGRKVVQNILRWVNDTNNVAGFGKGESLLIVYWSSDDPARDKSKADFPTLPTFDLTFLMPETGTESVNGLFGYKPDPDKGQPGAFKIGIPITYNFFSDVPEPSSFTIVLLAARSLGLGAGHRRWRNRRAPT